MPVGVYIRTKAHREAMSKAHMGNRQSEESKQKIREAFTGERNHQWKGDEVGYSGVHQWVYKALGTPKLCENCGTTTAKKFEWANLSGNYLRDVSDWARLCRLCHCLFDNLLPNLTANLPDDKRGPKEIK